MNLINHRILVQSEYSGYEVMVKESMHSNTLIRNNPWLQVNLEETDGEESPESEHSWD